jgi:mono/diheme cytochrome c family protein
LPVPASYLATGIQINKTMKSKATIVIAIIFGLTAAVFADDTKAAAPAASLPPASTKTDVTYATDIKPIFDAACVKCHDSKKPKIAAKLALDTLDGALKGSRDGKVITPGDSAHSDLVLSVAHVGDDPDSFMPKGKGAQKLTDEQIGLIRAWIDQGAK